MGRVKKKGASTSDSGNTTEWMGPHGTREIGKKTNGTTTRMVQVAGVGNAQVGWTGTTHKRQCAYMGDSANIRTRPSVERTGAVPPMRQEGVNGNSTLLGVADRGMWVEKDEQGSDVGRNARSARGSIRRGTGGSPGMDDGGSGSGNRRRSCSRARKNGDYR